MGNLRIGFVFPLLAGAFFAFIFAWMASAATPAAVNALGREAPQVPGLLAEQIVAKVHLTNATEIRAGDLAKEKGVSVLVQAYGDRLVRDHRQADRLLQLAADRIGAPVRPVGLWDAEKMPPLESTFGRAFDQTFVKMMIEDHLRAVADLSAAYAELPRDSPLRVFLGKLIPILKEHLQVAENIQRWI